MKAITQEMIDAPAMDHAKEQLGKQFSKNKLAAQAIAEDFKAGAKFLLEMVTEGNEEIINLT